MTKLFHPSIAFLCTFSFTLRHRFLPVRGFQIFSARFMLFYPIDVSVDRYKVFAVKGSKKIIKKRFFANPITSIALNTFNRMNNNSAIPRLQL